MVGAHLRVALPKRRVRFVKRSFAGLREDETWTAPWAVHARRELFSRLHGLRKSKAKAEEVLFVVSECRRKELLRDPRDWVVAISSLGNVHLWTESLDILQAMHSETKVAVHAFNATISATEKGQQWQIAVALFADIQRYSILPDTVTCNALLTAYDKGGQWQSALSLLDRVGPEFQLEPNVVSYSASMSACERGRAWEQALQVFNNMHANKIAGDVVAFNAALSALDRGSQWQEALALLQEMSKIKLKRSLASYGSAISACGSAFQWEESIELLNLLQKQSLQPSLIVMNLCLNACRKARNLYVALQLYNDMLRRSEKPDMLGYTSLISACGASAEWQLALQLHEDALLTSEADIMGFNAVLGVCRQASRWEESHRILADLENHDLSPTVPTYKAVIASCAYAMRWSDALSYLYSMQKLQQTPCREDLILQYGIVSKACAEAGFASRAQALLEVAAAEGLAPAEWLSVLHWQAALAYFEGKKQAMNDPDFEDGVQIVGLADVLLEAGRDADAISLLIQAQEAGSMQLWKAGGHKVLDLHDLGPGSCSAAVAEAAVGGALLQLAQKHNFCARHALVIITGRGRRSVGGIPLLLPAVRSFLVSLGLHVQQAAGSLRVSRASLHRFWQGERSG